MSEEQVKVCVWWLEHPRLQGVRTAVLLEAFYSADGKLIGGAAHSVGVSRIYCRAS
jgi:hypothetical protein